MTLKLKTFKASSGMQINAYHEEGFTPPHPPPSKCKDEYVWVWDPKEKKWALAAIDDKNVTPISWPKYSAAQKPKKKSNIWILPLVIGAIFLFALVNPAEGNGNTIPTPQPVTSESADQDKEEDQQVVPSTYAQPAIPPACQDDNALWLSARFTSLTETESGNNEYELDPDKDFTPIPDQKYCIRDPWLLYNWLLEDKTTKEHAAFNIEHTSSFDEDGSALQQYVTAIANRYRLTNQGSESKFMLRHNNSWYHTLVDWMMLVEADFFSDEIFIITFPDDAQYDLVDADKLKQILAGDNSQQLPYSAPPKQAPEETSNPSANPAQADQHPAYTDYVALVGQEQANADFMRDYNESSFVSFTADWNDFTGDTNVTAILRKLGPTGYTFQYFNGEYTARSTAKNADGNSAVITVTGLATTYMDGVWHLNPPGNFHWEETYIGDPKEIQLPNGAWIHPVYDDAQYIAATQASPINTEIVKLLNLSNYMKAEGLHELHTDDCPGEPLTGQVIISPTLIIDFDRDGPSSLKYSQDACRQVGGITFTDYNPGYGDAQITIGIDPVIYIYPMPFTVAHLATAIPPDGHDEFPPDGSKITLEDMIAYLDATGENSTLSRCSDTTNGEIPGWPTEVAVPVNTRTYLVDFTPIKDRIDETALCHHGDTVEKTTRNISIYAYQPDEYINTAEGTFYPWGGWFFGPFR